MNAFATYWRTYGGWTAFFLSPYLWLSGIFAVLCRPLWDTKINEKYEWLDWGISVLPSMLSFSLGALAIFLAFSNEKFLILLRQKGKPDSYLMNVVSAFFHFILVQFIAIAAVIFTMAHPWVGFSAFAFWALCYALATGIAASAALLDMADILNLMGGFDDDEDI